MRPAMLRLQNSNAWLPDLYQHFDGGVIPPLLWQLAVGQHRFDEAAAVGQRLGALLNVRPGDESAC